jgi:agmatinase
MKEFDPSGVAHDNGNFLALPFTESDAEVILLPVHWDVTASYKDGTASAAQNIVQASLQVDLYDKDYPDAWKRGIFMRDRGWLTVNNEDISVVNTRLRKIAKNHIDDISSGRDINVDQSVNEAGEQLRKGIKNASRGLLEQGKIVGVVGGEHSVSLGLLDALSEIYDSFGVLQIDAHFDLRKAFEGFTYSHASIFYNASTQIENIRSITHVGIRDYAKEECEFVEQSGGKHKVFFDKDIHNKVLNGKSYTDICEAIISTLPERVYISFDIDALEPNLCPATGTPVPGGFNFNEAIILLESIKKAGKHIVGFDVCEVGGVGNEWDGNVAARILYKLCSIAGK